MNLQKKQKVWHSFKHYTYCSNDKSKQTHMPDKKTCGILKFLLRRFALFFFDARDFVRKSLLEFRLRS